MTRRELRKIVYRACEKLETGLCCYSCIALGLALHDGYHPLIKRYAEFYGKSTDSVWLDISYEPGHPCLHIRIMLLLMFLEGERYV